MYVGVCSSYSNRELVLLFCQVAKLVQDAVFSTRARWMWIFISIQKSHTAGATEAPRMVHPPKAGHEFCSLLRNRTFFGRLVR